MNKYDNFFNNLFPLRPLFPFVQSVLPTVFDDSLSYLETLGKVIKALNDTESNVNTLEDAIRAFADDLALYGNLTISQIEITYNQETEKYAASMTYADIVSAIEDGHTLVLHVVDGLHNTEYYSATMKVSETGGVKMLYWESPAFTVNGVTVFYEPVINENDTVGVTTRTITGSSGLSDMFVVTITQVDTNYTCDYTYSQIMAQIHDGKVPVLKVVFNDNTYKICPVSQNSTITINGVEQDCIKFTDSAYLTTAYNDLRVFVICSNGDILNTNVGKYPATDNDVYNIINGGESNALLKTAQTLTGAEKAQARANIGAAVEPLTVEIANPSLENPNYTVDKTAEEIRNNLYNLRIRFGLNEGIVVDSYIVVGSPPTHSIICTVADPDDSSVTYTEFTLQVYYSASAAPTPADDVVTVTHRTITHNIGSGGVSNAVLYTQQNLTAVQKAQARDNIGADSRPLILNVTENNGVLSVDKTAAEIRANLHNLALTFGLNEGVYIDSYKIYGSAPYTDCVFTVTDPANTSVSYIEYVVSVYLPGYAPSESEDVPRVTRNLYTHNIGGGALPDATNARAGDFLRLDANKNVVWETVPAAENNSFGTGGVI